MCAISIYVPDSLRKICIEGVAQVEIVNEYANNGRKVTTTLKFVSADEIDVSVPYAIIYTDMLGKHYLVGAKEKPYPIVSTKQNSGVPGSSSAVIEYEVTWVSNSNPASCYVNFVD